MIISHKHKFIFIKTAKTAGTSIEVFLEKHCGNEDIVTPIYPTIKEHYPRNYSNYFNPLNELSYSKFRSSRMTLKNILKKEMFFNHIPAYLVMNRISKNVWNNYFKFCIERNPWDKTVSHYHMINYRSKNNVTFKEYLKHGKFCLNYPKYTDRKKGKVIVDQVIKYENLDAGLSDVFNQLGIPFSGVLNEKAKSSYRSSKSDYRSYYDDWENKIITKAFKKEIDLWNYEF